MNNSVIIVKQECWCGSHNWQQEAIKSSVGGQCNRNFYVKANYITKSIREVSVQELPIN